MFEPWRGPGRLRESAKAAVGGLLVVVWWQFVRFTGPVETVPCGAGTCPALRPDWIVLGMAAAATLVGLDWVRSTATEARAPVAAGAAAAVVLVGLDVARVFAGHYLTADLLAVEFLAFAAAGLLIAGAATPALARALRRLAG